MLFALRDGVLPPTANFSTPNPGLNYANGPFRVLGEEIPWERRAASQPRRAAVSAFGFGGINAHVLLEEWLPRAAVSVSVPEPVAAPDIAIVGMDAHFGRWRGLRAFQERVFGNAACAPSRELPWRGVERSAWFREQHPNSANYAGYFIEELHVAAERYRVPPRELEEMLPQQLLMLLVADGAMRDAGLADEVRQRMGVFVGIGLDLNTTNFHLRWAMLNEARRWNEQLGLNLTPQQLEVWTRQLRDAVGPPLTANATMGALGGIVASRVARTFRVGGPSFTVSSEETSGLRALLVAARLLQQGELDHALVGGVDLAGDVRAVLATDANWDYLAEDGQVIGEGAAAVVLKRLADARRDGDRIYAVLKSVGGAGGAGALALSRERAAEDGSVPLKTVGLTEVFTGIGACGAASGMAALVRNVLCLYHNALPNDVQFWLRDRGAGLRRAAVQATSVDGNALHVLLEEYENAQTPQLRRERRQPFGERRAGLFVVEADDAAGLRAGLLRLRAHAEKAAASPEALARSWFAAALPEPRRRLAVAVVAGDREELLRHLDLAEARLAGGTADERVERLFLTDEALAGPGRLAFVFPGSGNHYINMGIQLGVQWPEVLRRQDGENERLRSQLVPDHYWGMVANLAQVPHKAMIFAQVALGTVVCDLLADFGVRPDAALGYSLGESAALFGLRAWTARDEMLARMQASDLFGNELVGEYRAARRAWGLAANEPVDWLAGVVPCTPDDVRRAIGNKKRLYLLLINTPSECVVGGARSEVERLVRELGCSVLPLPGASTVHCDIAREVADAYRALHLLPTTAPDGVRFYSSAWAAPYEVTRKRAADAILAQALQTVDFPAVVRRAYADSVRLFVEVGPGASCTRWIGRILGDQPHTAQAVCVSGQDEVTSLLRVLALLITERVPVDLRPLYGEHTASAEIAAPERLLRLPVRREPFQVPPPLVGQTFLSTSTSADRNVCPTEEGRLESLPHDGDPLMRQFSATTTARNQAHEAHLRFAARLTQLIGGQLSLQMSLLEAQPPAIALPTAPAVFLDRSQCLEFAVGAIAKVLGPDFAEADTYPTRVRLPDEPLMLVDRILSVEGEPRSMTAGRVVTEHDIRPGAWYLDGGRIPVCIAVESGQADLFLSGYLGIDFITRGLAVYRLLDAQVTFHRGLPGPGTIIRYDIHIDHFFRQDQTYLFRFRFEGTVNGEPLLTMTNGVAGFFTAAELTAGKGVVRPGLDRQPRCGTLPPDWRPPVPLAPERYDERKLDALRRGDLDGCFGGAFAGRRLAASLWLPGGRMKLVDRLVALEPDGGRFGIGLIRAEADIRPDAWFLTCHFVDDRVMPGTLMYECCLHTLRIFLLRLGWISESEQVVCDPLPGIASRLKCRGQVTETTRVVTYEVHVKQLGYNPDAFAIVDALMYADGKPIVDITDMTLRLTGLTREAVAATWAADSAKKPAIFDTHHILAFAVGKPSEAFGERLRDFDDRRFIARLPGPPYQILDRITEVHAEPWKLVAGGTIEAQYDVPPDAWYFAAERHPVMPFAVLLELALQPCGWFAAYMGAALTSPDDLCFRNLGGSAVQHAAVAPDAGTLTTTVQATKVANSGGMIINHFAFTVRDGRRVVYEGETYFGFFSRASLAQQVGIRDAAPYAPTAAEQARGRTFAYPTDAPFPDTMLRMVDRIDCFVLDGGPPGLGFLAGSKTVDPGEWFFKAHFYQDPVWPGSLGVEAFLQLLKVTAVERWGRGGDWHFDTARPGQPHRWVYRGQVLPSSRRVEVQATVTAVDDVRQRLMADGWLSVDGRVIYQLSDFALTWAPATTSP